MLYGFIPVKGTIDTVLILKRLAEKFRSKNKKFFYVFADHEKAFDQYQDKIFVLLCCKKVSQNTW